MTNIQAEDVLRSADGVTSPVSHTVDEHGRVVVSLAMAPQAYQMLEDLAESSGTPLDEIIGKAFLLYKVSADARCEGKAVGIAPTADVLESEFVGI